MSAGSDRSPGCVYCLHTYLHLKEIWRKLMCAVVLPNICAYAQLEALPSYESIWREGWINYLSVQRTIYITGCCYWKLNILFCLLGMFTATFQYICGFVYANRSEWVNLLENQYKIFSFYTYIKETGGISTTSD